MPQKTRPDDSFLNFPVNTSMTPAQGDLLFYSTGTQQWTNTPTGTLNANYLLLDTSNDPLTGNLLILTTGSLPNPPLNLSQITTSGNNTLTGSVIYLSRTESNGSNTYVAPFIQLLNKANTAMGGGILSYVATIAGVSTEKIRIDPLSTGTSSVFVLFDSENVFDAVNGKLLLLKNNGASRFYVNASGTAFSNDVALIKEAPTDGSVYARKSAGWETTNLSNGWIPQTFTWIRTGNHTLIVSGNLTGTYQKGTKLWYTDSGVGNKYGVVGSYTFTSGTTTTLNLIPNTDYIASGTVANPYISYTENPVGWPDSFNYSSTITAGVGSLTSYTLDFSMWKIIGKQIKIDIRVTITNNGTGAGYIDATLPITSTTQSYGPGRENVLTGSMLVALCNVAGTSCSVLTYNNLYPGGTTAQIAFSLIYGY